MTERENWLEITLRLPAGELGSLLRSLAGDGTGGNPGAARENSAFEPERFGQLRRQGREKTGDPAEELKEAADRGSREGTEAPERAETTEKSAPSRRTGRAGREGVAAAFCDFGEKSLLKDIEKLMGRTIPVVEGHPYPMVVLEAPKKDKRGRIINEEDAEARAAAKERRRAQDEANKAAAEERKKKAGEAVLSAVSAVAAAVTGEGGSQDGKKRKRRRKKGKGEAAPVQEAQAPETPVRETARVKPLRPGVRLDTGDAMPRTEFDRPDPLAGDHIMDATARLLAPRKSTLSREGSAASRRAAPRKRRRGNAGGEGESRAAAGKEKSQRTAAPAEAGRKKRGESGEGKARPAARSSKKHRGGPRGPIEPMKSNRTKDSTEQHSLMKPYYLDN